MQMTWKLTDTEPKGFAEGSELKFRRETVRREEKDLLSEPLNPIS